MGTSGPTADLRALVDTLGAASRPAQRLVAELAAGGAATPAELVRATGLPRRFVDRALVAAADDLEHAGGRLRLASGAEPAYRALFGPMPTIDEAALAARLAPVVAGAPPPLAALDHVPALPETLARRAAHLATAFDLAGRTVLFVGDHDLTSLALALASEAEPVVVDIDERLLAYLDEQAAAAGVSISTLVGDLRFGLPPSARGVATLAVTDPPYTAAGVSLFARRGLEGCAELTPARLVVSYGYGAAPGLGLKVQRALLDLGLVVEAALPAFNRYDGAEALGATSDLYVLRPTATTRRELRTAGPAPVGLYTRGPQSSEAAPLDLSAIIPPALRTEGPVIAGAPAVGALLAGEGPEGPACVVDLRFDPGALLLRVLLRARTDRVVVVVDGRHPDVGERAATARLASIVAGRTTITAERGTPAPGLATVRAERLRRPRPTPAAEARARVLDDPAVPVADAVRHGLLAAGVPDEQAARLVATVRGTDRGALVEELPRQALGVLLADVEQVAARTTA